MRVGGPTQLFGKVRQLSRTRDLRMIPEDALQQGGPRARYADDEDWLRTVAIDIVLDAPGESPVADIHEHVELALFASAVVRDTRAHDRIAARQGLPRFLASIQVVQFLEAGELERSVVFAALCNAVEPGPDGGKMIVSGRLPAHARQCQEGAAVCRPHLQTRFELGFRLPHP